MRDKYSPRERIQMIMEGEKPDRFAASAWRHFLHLETNLEKFVGVMLDFQKRFDWDFMKINPRACYHAEDWGTKAEWSTDECVKHRLYGFPVDEIEDWDRIQVLPPDTPVLTEHLKAVSRIRKATGPDLPLFMTVFNPLGVARHLVDSKEKLIEHLNKDPDRVNNALEKIATTFEQYVPKIIDAGADGLFYATVEWGTSEVLTFGQYEKFSKPYDLRILKATGADAINILHVCQSNNFLKELADYPVRLVNWEANDPTNPSIENAFGFLGDKTVIAGLDHQGWLKHATPSEVATEVGKIKERMEGKRFIFGPGCTMAPEVSIANLHAVRENL
jgi:uroporphyrinogen decarboxylase